MPSTVTVHYSFHPLHNHCLDVLAWPRQATHAVTVQHPDGQSLKIPRWMLQPEAAGFHLSEQIELAASALLALGICCIRALKWRPRTRRSTAMQQITLELNSNAEDQPSLALEPEREQQLITLMSQLIVAVVQNQRGLDYEIE
jgi:hypothetical protein